MHMAYVFVLNVVYQARVDFLLSNRILVLVILHDQVDFIGLPRCWHVLRASVYVYVFVCMFTCMYVCIMCVFGRANKC